MNKSKIIVVLLAFSIFALAQNNLLGVPVADSKDSTVTIKTNNDTNHSVKITAYGYYYKSVGIWLKKLNWQKSKTAKKNLHKNIFGRRTYKDLKTIAHKGKIYKIQIEHLGGSKKTFTIFETNKHTTRSKEGTWYLKITGDEENNWVFTTKKPW